MTWHTKDKVHALLSSPLSSTPRQNCPNTRLSEGQDEVTEVCKKTNISCTDADNQSCTSGPWCVGSWPKQAAGGQHCLGPFTPPNNTLPGLVLSTWIGAPAAWSWQPAIAGRRPHTPMHHSADVAHTRLGKQQLALSPARPLPSPSCRNLLACGPMRSCAAAGPNSLRA